MDKADVSKRFLIVTFDIPEWGDDLQEVDELYDEAHEALWDRLLWIEKVVVATFSDVEIDMTVSYSE